MPGLAAKSLVRWGITVTILVGAMFVFTLSAQDVESAKAQVSGNEDDSGGQYSSRIVGGTAVPDGKYPFVVALLDKRFQGTAYDQRLCAGTLIAPDKVLTVAHCLGFTESQNLQTVIGRTVLDSNQGQVRNVSRIDVHPRYNAAVEPYRYDAAVLTLKRPVANVQPIKLATPGQNSLEKPGSAATIAGWGNTEEQPADGFGASNYPNRMREARVPLVSDAKARQSYPDYVPAIMVAAGKVGKDSCAGDSGGPMFARTASGYTQIGIASGGIGCAAPNYPGVYTEINNPRIKSFIDAQLANTTSNTQTSRVSQSNSQVVNISQSGN